MFSNNMYKELEQLKARVGWLDHLDTEEGRRMHANEALLVEIERLKAENELMRNHIESAETECYVQLGALRVSLEQADKDRDILRAEIERLKAELAKLKEAT